MKRVRKFGPNAFKPKMPVAASRTKKFAEGGKVSPMPKRKLRPEEDPNYNPMDDLAPRGNLPSPEDTPNKYKSRGPSTRGGRRGPPKRNDNEIVNENEVVVTPESYRESLSPKERERFDREQQDLKRRREKNIFNRQNIDPDTYRREFGRKGHLTTIKTGGVIKSYAKGGMVRGGGCETKGKTRGKFV